MRRRASDIRDGMLLWRGRASDSLPSDVRDAEGANRILGGGPGEGSQLAERYARAARHARTVTERVFYGREPTDSRAAPASHLGEDRAPEGTAGARSWVLLRFSWDGSHR